MSLPWSEMMDLIKKDNELNPSPSAIATLPKKTISQRFNPYKKPSSISNEPANSNDLTALHQWIDNLMQTESDVPEPDLFQPAPSIDSTGKEIKMRNAQGKDLIRPLRDYSDLFDPTHPLPENPELSKGKGNKQAFWYWLLQLLIDPSMREIVAWTGNGREFIILNDNAITDLWSRHEGRAVPVQFDSIRRTIRTHYKRDILIPADTKSRKNRRWAFYTEPSIHIGMTREQLTDYITSYNTTSPPSSAEKSIEDVPFHPYPTTEPSAESFFNFAASPPPPTMPQTNQFSYPSCSYPTQSMPPTEQVPEYSYPHPADPSHFQSLPITEPMPEYTVPTPSNPPPPVEMSQSPEHIFNQSISNIEKSLPVLEINDFDLEFDPNVESDDWSDALFF